MSSTKTTGERIDTLQEKIQQLENQKKVLLQKQKSDERKARTRRLIERGAILENLISDADKLTNDQIKSFLEKIINTESAQRNLNAMTVQDREATIKSPWNVTANNKSTTDKTEDIESGSG